MSDSLLIEFDFSDFPFYSLTNSDLNSLLTPYCLKISEINSDLKQLVNNLFPDVCQNDCSFGYYSSVQLNDIVNKFKTNTRTLKVFHVNIRSLNCKYLKLIEFLTVCSFQFDIIVLSEIWSSNIVYMQNILVGYTFFYKISTVCKAGGVGIFVKNDLNPKLKNSLSDIGKNDTHLEHIWIEFTIKSKKYCVGGFYRHPNTPVNSFTDILAKILHKINKNTNYFILGDMNIDLCKYDKDPNTKLYVDLMCSFNLIPYSFLPTRITSTSATIIDHLFSNCQALSSVSIKSGLLTCDISDHLGNFMIINTNIHADLNARPFIRIFNSKNIASFLNDLNSTDWSDIFTVNCVNDAFDLFLNLYSSLFHKYFPLVKQSRRNFKHKNWISRALQTSIHHKNALYKRWLTSRSVSDELLYKSYAKTLKNLLFKARSIYYKNLLDGCINSTKNVWKCLNSLTSSKCKTNSQKITKIVHNNQVFSNESTIPDAFNNYFIGISHDLRKSIPSVSTNYKSFLKSSMNNSFFCMNSTPSEIIDIINNIKSSGCAGPDGIPSLIIKHSKYAIANILSHLCNLSFSSGVFPNSLKVAKVFPLFKNGDRKLISNYRPISLLNAFSKIVEKLMCNRLNSYLSKYNLLYDFQFGFRSGHSCTLALVDVINMVKRESGNKNHVMGLFMDLSKAFDMVNHDILLHKLSHYGLRGNTLNWFSSYIANRTQFTTINDINSTSKTIVSGIPQGSVLGPILFLIYINDLYLAVKDHKLSLFADDANVFIIHRDPSTLFQIANDVCTNLFEWFSANELCINLTKTSFMLFNPSKSMEEHLLRFNPSIFINGNKINRVKSCKYLGLLIDENLNWADHINYLKTKVTQITGILYKSRDLLSFAHKKSIYYSLIYSSITYGLELYGQTFSILLNPLNVAINRALRVVLKCPLETPLKKLYANFDTLPINLLHQFVICKLIFRCIHMKNIVPTVIQDIFNCNVSVHHYATRAQSSSLLYRYANDGYSSSYSHYVCTVWNHLPISIRNTTSLSMFTKLTKLHLSNSLL